MLVFTTLLPIKGLLLALGICTKLPECPGFEVSVCLLKSNKYGLLFWFPSAWKLYLDIIFFFEDLLLVEPLEPLPLCMVDGGY